MELEVVKNENSDENIKNKNENHGCNFKKKFTMNMILNFFTKKQDYKVKFNQMLFHKQKIKLYWVGNLILTTFFK